MPQKKQVSISRFNSPYFNDDKIQVDGSKISLQLNGMFEVLWIENWLAWKTKFSILTSFDRPRLILNVRNQQTFTCVRHVLEQNEKKIS